MPIPASLRRSRVLRRTVGCVATAGATAGLALVAWIPGAGAVITPTVTCQPDGTYLLEITWDGFVADSTVTGGVSTLSGAFVGTVAMSPTYLPTASDVSTGSTSIPGSTAGAVDITIALTSPNGNSGGGNQVVLAGDCVPVVPTAPAVSPPAVAPAAVAVDATPRVAG